MQQYDHQQLDFLTAAMPPEVWALPAELAAVDHLLGDPAIIAPLVARLDPVQGRPSVPAAQILRLFYLKDRYQLADRVLIQEVADSFHWRRFCHFGVADALPHPSTLTYWRRRLGPEGILVINRAVTARLHTEKIVRGRRFRMDSTVVEAAIHHPTDAGLIADGIRRVTRMARRLYAVMEAAPVPIRDRARSVKRKILAIGKLLRRRTGDAVTEVRRVTEDLARTGEAQGRAIARLLDVAKQQIAVLDQGLARRVAQTEQALHDLQTVIRQSRAATAREPIAHRVVSVADPDARPIKKGKLGHPVQFGYKVQIVEAEQGFVTDYMVHIGNPPDADALSPALDQHRVQFGRHPDIVATDRGYDGAANQRDCERRGIKTVAIPKRGKKSAARIVQERRPAFRRAQRWRAGGEATISRLKRKYGLRRSRYRGYEAVATGIGLGIFTHNVRRWAQRQAV
ncbi:ISNCY family transposase [Sulfobacillus harzensis]|uniref:ISNCY family transposase n=1 Tax=Sulfobacillus harzensis TaxID=2729629 RepID=A0A7Y0L891_9FIRM|nr:ISNCY family transposase [Sulfobacillus harzensis]NMP25133.1 ISNCY family transposase [Sulfobacillus harzensis]